MPEFFMSSVMGWQGDIQDKMFLRVLVRRYTTQRWYCMCPDLMTLRIYGSDGLPGSLGVRKRYMAE